MKKLYDAVVCTGRYTDANGQEKARWQNVGAVIEGREGKILLLLERWFNPAGVVDDKGGENVLINLMPPNDRSNRDDQPF